MSRLSTRIIPWLDEKDRPAAGCGASEVDVDIISLIQNHKKFEWQGYVLCEHNNRAWKEVIQWMRAKQAQAKRRVCRNHTSAGHEWTDFKKYGDPYWIECSDPWWEVFEECRHV